MASRKPTPRSDSPDTHEWFDDLTSGAFDDELVPEAPQVAVRPKRVLLAQTETPKLHKVLAQSGLGSRLDMEAMIRDGRISVNGQLAHVGQRIQSGDQIRVDGKPIRYRLEDPTPRVLAYHKPAGEIVSHDDPHNRPSVFRTLPHLAAGKWLSIGRLDLNTEGLLLFSNSGNLANRLMHPRFGMEREYAVRILGRLTDEASQRLLDGVDLDDGPANFESLHALGHGEGVNTWYRVTIREGRNREVRRMFEAVGHVVSRLIRVRYGPMVLPRGLRRGAWVELFGSDLFDVLRSAGITELGGAAAPKTTRRHSPDRGKVKSTKPKAPSAKAVVTAQRLAARPGDAPAERNARKDFIGEQALSRRRANAKKSPTARKSARR